jgi:peptide subunit release factor 1 (eRF1)
MDVKQVLKELIAIPEQQFPVASLFLDASRANEHQREALRIFVAEEARRAIKASKDPEAEHLPQTLQPIEDYVAGLLRHRHDDAFTGVAIYSCAPIGLFRVIATRMPFRPMELTLDRRPCVEPFVRTCASTPPVLLAAVSTEETRLYELSCGVVDIEARFERAFPGRHSRGGWSGWSQRNFSAHLGAIRDRNLRAAAEPLTKVSDALPGAAIVLAGQSFILKQYESHLPERVLARVVTRVAFPQGLTNGELRDRLLSDARPSLERALGERHRSLRDEVLAQSAARGLGVTGIPAVLLALETGQVQSLLVDPALHAPGVRCTVCDALASDGPSCRFCGGALRAVKFPEEIIRRAFYADAEIVMLPRDGGLPDGAGVAARLRHRGTAGAEPAQQQDVPA